MRLPGGVRERFAPPGPVVRWELLPPRPGRVAKTLPNPGILRSVDARPPYAVRYHYQHQCYRCGRRSPLAIHAVPAWQSIYPKRGRGIKGTEPTKNCVCPGQAPTLLFRVLVRLQTASAVLLLLLASVFGQVGIQQCLCTGKVTFGSEVVSQCEDDCCETHGDAPAPGGMPSPCDDGACYLLISLDAADPPPITASTPVPVAICPSPFARTESPSRLGRAERPPVPHRPPDRAAVPLTVLFSSFLI